MVIAKRGSCVTREQYVCAFLACGFWPNWYDLVS
jgi:hypothetical protein